MTIKIKAATYAAVDFIAHELRAYDYAEITATSDIEDLADRVTRFSRAAFVAFLDDLPVSCWGLLPMWPGVGLAYAFGTQHWGKVLLPMTKHVARFMLPYLLDNGYHRIECRSLASRDDTRRWLTLFGARPEAVLRSSGKRGEDFILYVWLRDEHRAPQSPQTGTAARLTAH